MNHHIIFHIPHSSTYIPDDAINQFIITEDEIQNELNLLTDSFTDELYFNEKIDTIIFPISRMVVDPERFANDEEEVMSKKGMGVIYKKSSKGQTIRRELLEKEKENLLEKYYSSHHHKLEVMVEEKLEKNKLCLIIDCHSFPSVPFPFEDDQSLLRPDICIGTDDFHTPTVLKNKFLKQFRKKGYSVEFNRPFAGSIVPTKYYKINKDVFSIMIEINRKLYMNEQSIKINSNFNIIQSDIREIIKDSTGNLEFG